MVTIARQAIREAARALDRNEILNAIEAAGHKLKSKNPQMYVNKTMWSSTEFQHVEDGYYFTGQPVPKSNKDSKARASLMNAESVWGFTR